MESTLIILKRIRERPCPSCASLAHHPVDIDGEGEYLRYCDGCGENFRVREEDVLRRSAYAPTIKEALDVSYESALIIEEVMRDDQPTLDHLSRPRLLSLARQARKTYTWMLTADPETAAWVREQAIV